MKTINQMLNAGGSPSAWDSRNNYVQWEEDEKQDWFIVLGRNRDSDILTESNWHSALKLLGGEHGNVGIVRHGHWACGWVEYLVVNPADAEKVKIAQDIQKRIEGYPVLDEDDFSEREEESANEVWNYCYTLKEKVDMCREYGVSIFAARHKYYPNDDHGYIRERLTSN